MSVSPQASAGGEFGLIARHFERRKPGRAALGIGDDCALIDPGGEAEHLAISTDMLVAGRHFVDEVSPDALGHKALAVNLSDLAAMGARPVAFTLALALPQIDDVWLEQFCAGLFALGDRHGCELIGGDTTRGPLNVCITVFGQVPGALALRRDKARPGDDLWVSGELGGAAFAVEEGHAERALAIAHPARQRLDRPEPRIELGFALRGIANAAIDLSDGLAGDLRHIRERSGVAACVNWDAVPRSPVLDGLAQQRQLRLALSGGDDYELLFSASPERRSQIERIETQLGLPLSRIGRIESGDGWRVVDARGQAIEWSDRGFDHFI